MKYRVYAILHLIILVFYIARPVIPYIQYAAFKDYIASNLCVNKDIPKSCCKGKCYLEKQLKKSTENNDTEEKGTNKKITNKEIKEFLTAHISVPKATSIAIHQIINAEAIIVSQAVSAIFVPPKV